MRRFLLAAGVDIVSIEGPYDRVERAMQASSFAKPNSGDAPKSSRN